VYLLNVERLGIGMLKSPLSTGFPSLFPSPIWHFPLIIDITSLPP